MISFLLPSIIAGILLCISAAPIGCIVVWRRMSYLGETLAHSALLGVAISLLFDWHTEIGVGLVALLIALLMMPLERFKHLSRDTLLGVIAHSSLAFGLITLHMNPNNYVDPMALLMGDILTLTWPDVIRLGGLSLLLWSILALYWRRIVVFCLSEELAQVEYGSTQQVRIAIVLVLALFVTVAIKLVGVLLITALLIIPSATARFFSKTPNQMLIISLVSSLLSLLIGMFLSVNVDIPTGPGIVASAAILFCLSKIINGLTSKS
ncbi:MAG: hypothetical protein CMF25_02640 [Kangiellaceae bacterium]|jgi:zinc transport system permease protein|nr:hypothetical protein [Kangiellaceae bacterium]|tara:strand:- start:4724 stop:5518 length:795 start_codon:yes stop_codon:yes gene_type:complete